MQLYVGNATKQVVDFTYRLPEDPGIRRQQIPIGAQVRLAGSLSPRDVEFVIAHHRRYGLVPSDEIDRTRAFTGICYSVDKPITASKLTLLMERNNDVLIERGKEIRKASAVAINDQLERNLEENPGLGANLRRMDVSVVEEEPAGGYQTDKPLGEGYRVEGAKEGGRAPAGKRKGRRK